MLIGLERIGFSSNFDVLLQFGVAMVFAIKITLFSVFVFCRAMKDPIIPAITSEVFLHDPAGVFIVMSSLAPPQKRFKKNCVEFPKCRG